SSLGSDLPASKISSVVGSSFEPRMSQAESAVARMNTSTPVHTVPIRGSVIFRESGNTFRSGRGGESDAVDGPKPLKPVETIVETQIRAEAGELYPDANTREGGLFDPKPIPRSQNQRTVPDVFSADVPVLGVVRRVVQLCRKPEIIRAAFRPDRPGDAKQER